MKKIIALMCALILVLSVVSCGNEGTAMNDGSVLDSRTTVGLESKIGGELTVSCYDTVRYKQFLEEAAKVFEEQYPSTRISIETFSAMPETKTQEENGKTMKLMIQGDDTQSKNDYINKINTELMSGKGADILALDVIPFYKYAENEQLENLRAYMDNDPDFNIDNYRTNIFDALTEENRQYIFPMDYSFNYVAFDSSLFNDNEQAVLQASEKLSYEQIIELGKEPFESVNATASEPIKMFGLTYGVNQKPNMFSVLFNENYSSFIDVKSKEANFTDGSFVSLLNKIKEYNEKGYLKQSTGGMSMTPDMLEKITEEQFFFKSKSSTSLMNEFNKNTGRRIMSAGTGNEENDKISAILTNDKGETPFSFIQAYGINSNSNNKQTAWEFIKFLSNEYMQESLNLMGLPINKSAFLEKSKMDITGALYSPENVEKELDKAGQIIFDSYVALVEKYTGLINTYFVNDTTINSIVDTEIKNFFDGTKSAEEVASVLQNKVSLYLNE